MPGERVQISLEVVKRGFEHITELSQKLNEAQASAKQMEQKVKQLETQHERHTNALLKARQAIIHFRRELFAISFVAASVTAALIGLSRASDSLGGQIERGGTEVQRFAKNLGDLVAASGVLQPFIQTFKVLADLMEKVNRFTQSKSGGRGQGETAATGIAIDTLRARTLALQGRTRESKELELNIQFLKEIQPLLQKGGTGIDRMKQAWIDYRKESLESLRLTELGLKRQSEIMKDFTKDIVGAFRGGTSETLFKFLQGEKQSGTDILKTFTTGINRAVSEALSQSLFTSLAGGKGNFFENFMNILKGKNSTTTAVEKQTMELGHKLDSINAATKEALSCVCYVANNLDYLRGNRGSPVVSIEGGSGGGWLSKLGAIAGGISAIGGIFGGGKGGGGGLPPGAGITMAVPQLQHSGGFVRAYQSGGEVPAFVQPGEFVVRKPVAQDNKELLRELNAGGKPVKGAQNVFLIRANDASSFAEMLKSPSARAEIEVAVIRAVMDNSAARKVIKDFAR